MQINLWLKSYFGLYLHGMRTYRLPKPSLYILKIKYFTRFMFIFSNNDSHNVDTEERVFEPSFPHIIICLYTVVASNKWFNFLIFFDTASPIKTIRLRLHCRQRRKALRWKESRRRRVSIYRTPWVGFDLELLWSHDADSCLARPRNQSKNGEINLYTE